MAEYRITYWREIASMVTARDGAATSKAALPGRFQEAIDEAAMRQGMAGSDAYLEQWHHGEWERADGTPDELVAALSEQLDNDYDAARLESLLEGGWQRSRTCWGTRCRRSASGLSAPCCRPPASCRAPHPRSG